MLKEIKLTWNKKKTKCNIPVEGDYYLINVSQIIWVHPIINKEMNYNYVEIRFEDGSTLTVKNSKDEILEMMILKPWWKNLIDFFKWIFIKKRRVK